jgi:hypothetical protein
LPGERMGIANVVVELHRIREMLDGRKRWNHSLIQR